MSTAAYKKQSGFTLIELMVAVGLFAVIMLLASGAYLLMIGLNREAQGITTGVNNLAFALETMTRTIRTGTAYSCGAFGGDCTAGTSFTVTNQDGVVVTYQQQGTSLVQIVPGPFGSQTRTLTDSSVTITSLKFYASGTRMPAQSDYTQARVTVSIAGTVQARPGKPPQSFVIETGATMRGNDL